MNEQNETKRVAGGVIKSRSTKVGDLVIAFVCLLLIFICLLPMLNVLARSLSSSEALLRNEVLLCDVFDRLEPPLSCAIVN